MRITDNRRGTAAGTPRATAHGIQATGAAKMAGVHLSDAANEPTPYRQDETAAGDLTEADVERIYHGLGGLTGAARESQLYADKGTAMEMDRRGPNAGLVS